MTEHIALFDVDGVVADTTRALLQELKRYEQEDDGPLPELEDIKTMKLQESLPPFYAEMAETVMNGSMFWGSLPVIPGAQEGIESFRKAGFRVIFVSAPWTSCPMWEDQRRIWLAENMGADPNEDFISCPGKLKHLVDGDTFTDDKIETVLDWAKNHPKRCAYLYQQPWNADHRNLPFNGLRVSWARKNNGPGKVNFEVVG